MKKKIFADEVLNFGPFTMARFGEIIEYKNNMNMEECNQYLKTLAESYDEVKNKIDNLVVEIRNDISKIEPLSFLLFLREKNKLISFGKIAEIDYETEDCKVMRAMEYALSVLMSTKIIVVKLMKQMKY